MRISLNMLSVFVGALSLVVLYQSVFILQSFLALEKKAEREMAQPLPAEVEERLQHQALEEAAEMDLLNQGDDIAILELRPLSCWDCLEQVIEIVLRSSSPLGSVSVDLVIPQSLTFIDQVEDIDGVQARFGEADRYLKNEIVDGVLELDAVFENGFTGEMVLGSVEFQSSDESYVNDWSWNKSYVTDFETGKIHEIGE